MGDVVLMNTFPRRVERPRPKEQPVEVVIFPAVRVERHDVDLAPRPRDRNPAKPERDLP